MKAGFLNREPGHDTGLTLSIFNETLFLKSCCNLIVSVEKEAPLYARFSM